MSADDKSQGDYRQNEDTENTVPRLRRTKSTSKAQQINQEERLTRQKQPDRPIHAQRDSLLTWTSGFENFDGWFVYAIILFTMNGSVLLLENMVKYGVQVSPKEVSRFVFSQLENEFYRTPMFLLLTNVNFLFVYYLEHELAKGKISSSRGTMIHAIHLFLVPIVPAALILNFPNMFSLLGRVFICGLTWVFFFKIWSYVQVNKWCRISLDIQKQNKSGRSRSFSKLVDDGRDEADKPSAQNTVEYPNNLTLSDLYYFLAAPTLCYELNFPRSQRIRIGFLLKRVFEVIVMMNIWLVMVQQWVIPTVKGSYKAFTEMDYMWCTERILKLAVPFHFMWLIFFYLFFHSWLNVLAEILRFGDRKFYEDWWNARDLGVFWKTWNLPFHNWAVRHMYIPMIKSKYSKTTANTAIFFLSAIFHEYFVSVTLIMFKILTFIAFFAMVPLVHISRIVADNFGVRFGNTMMWLFQVLGLSIGLLVYYHDYLIRNYSVNDI